MSEQLVVHCLSCSQKYRVVPAAVGRKVRCAKCQAEFIISIDKPTDEDTILGWISEDSPLAQSAKASTVPPGSQPSQTGHSEHISKHPVASAAPMPAEQVVHLAGVRDDGAHFEFPAAALAREDLRNSFPRKCVGCSVRTGLRVHLLYWPERMIGQDRARWKERVDTVVSDLEMLAGASDAGWLAKLPRARHVDMPFDLPFPLFGCGQCKVSKEVETHVTGKAPREICQLRIASLSVAVSFLRNNGGRGSHAYQRLIEERDRRHDPWRELDPQIRQGIAQWFAPQQGERFVRFFHDEEFSPLQANVAGAVLTDRRLLFKLHAECEGYPLRGDGRIEIMRKGSLAIAHIYLQGQRPAVLKLGLFQVDELLKNLKELHCRWSVVT
jgi:hypothetical protein